jgi:translocation and assembly module TamB
MRFDAGNFELRQLDARWPKLTATATGQARADGSIGFGGRVDVDIGPLAAAVGMPGASGLVLLNIDVRGRSDAIAVAGSVRAPALDVRGATVTALAIPFRFSESTLRVERASARVGATRVSADASATWPATARMPADALRGDAQVRADIRATNARFEDLAPLLPAALNGRGEYALTVHGEGTLRRWRGTGTLNAPSIELPAGALRQLSARFALDGTKLEIADLRVDAFGVPAHAAGAWAWAGDGSVKATLGPAPLAGLSMLPPGMRLQGTARATLDAVVRSPADIGGAVHAAFDDVAVNGMRLGRGQLDASGKDGVFRAALAFPEQRLQLDGSGRVHAGKVLSAELALPGVDVGLLGKFLGPSPIPLGGTVSARATGRVPLAEPRRGDGALWLEPVHLVVGSETWEARGPLQVRWANGAVSVPAFRLAARDGVVSGEGTLAAGGALDARVTARLPLGMLQKSRPEIREIDGALEVALRASGTLAQPNVAGDGAIHRGSLLLRERPETLRDFEARFALSSQGVQLKEATGTFSGGRVEASGELALHGWQPGAYRVRLRAQNVAVGEIEYFASAWDADLELGGLTGQAQLTGRARLVRGLYTRDLSIISLVMSPTRAAAADTATPVRLRVRIDLDDNLVVRSRGTNLRAGGVLNVEGTTARPVVFGSIESRDGHILFRGHTWSVTSAAVRFADPRRIDPYLDVTATSRIAEYDVTMQISGPVSNVNVRFSSTPRLSQNDLLSLVAFGVTGADLKESPGTVLLGETGKLLAQNVLGIDPSASGFRVTTGSSAGGASELHGFPGEERSIATQTTPGKSKDTVRIEYRVVGPVYLSGEYDREGGGYGADVVLRFRFR